MKLSSILLYVSDLDRSIGFYRDAVGAATNKVDDDVAIVQIGNENEIILHRDPSDFPEHLVQIERCKFRGLGVIIHIEVNDVDLWTEHFRKCGFTPSMAPTNQFFGRRQCYVYDPDGYNIVIEQKIPTS